MTSASQRVEEGVRHLRRADWQQARGCFEQAVRDEPSNAVAVNCLGIVARQERRWDEAAAHFRQAIALRPEFAEAHNNLGNACRDRGDMSAAVDCYRRALAIHPQFAEAHNNLGVVLHARGDSAEAIRNFREAIRLRPDYAEAHQNLADALRLQGFVAEAVANLQTALQLAPTSPEAHHNLGVALREVGQSVQARRHFEEAIRLRPEFAAAYNHLGAVLLDLDLPGRAIAAYEQVHRLEPSTVDSWLNLGNAYRLAGRMKEARRAYQRVADLEPANPWHRVRLSAQCPPAFRSRAEAEYERKRVLSEWPPLAEEVAHTPWLDGSVRLVEPAFAWQFLSGNIRPLKEAFAEIVRRSAPPEGRLPLSQRSASSPPRVGIVVTAGHEGIFLRSLAGIFARWRPAATNWVVFCPQRSAAALRVGLGGAAAIRPLPNRFHDQAVAIAAEQCSVLYFWEIGTDATNYYLPFLRLAPLQCTSWGVQVTSGIREVDYYLGLDEVEPIDAQEHYTEQLVRARSLLTYQVPPVVSQRRAWSRSEFGFLDQQHLYVCGQQLGKFHPDFDPLLAAILRADGNGLVVGISDRSGAAERMVSERFRAAFPEVADRLLFLPRLEFDDYLRLIDLADAVLDPPHFGGVNSTYDALAVGQPIVTWPSTCHRGRYTAACLRRIGVTETIAVGADDYVSRAVRLGTDPGWRGDLRQAVRRSADAVFRDELAVREHERWWEWLCTKAEEKGSQS